MNYKAAVVPEQGKVVVKEFEKPDVLKRDMIVKVLLAGVCGTDVHLVYDDGEKPWKEFRLGHEWVGRIEEMGQGAIHEDSFGNALSVGDRIVCYPKTWACGECYTCKILLQPNLCLRPPLGRELPDMGSAFSEYIYIPDGSTIFRIPDDMKTEEAVLVEPFAGALRAFERAFAPGVPDRAQGFGPGKSVVIEGSGTIGTIMTILAKNSGAYPIIVIGGPENRLEKCREYGADIIIDIACMTREERLEMVLKNTVKQLGADAVFECAGVPSAFVDGISMTRPGGTFVEFGHYTRRGTIPFDPFEVCQKDIQIFGSWGYGPQEFGTALRVIQACKNQGVDFSRMITHRFSLADIQTALDVARRQDCTKAVIEC